MVPNGSAYANFPSFANNGTKTPPGGSTESAKYALGMVPADTFPAEWANYLFHGATAGITRLNSDTGSIKKEINTVLDNFNITPDATLNNQLLAALNKLKADAALAAHPVGSLYWTSVNENPATTFGGGTWVQIKDRFILAAGDTYTAGNTGGSATVTLTTAQMPNHTHTFTGTEHSHSYTPQGKIASTSGGTDNKTATESNHTHSFSGSSSHNHKVASFNSTSDSGTPTVGLGYNASNQKAVGLSGVGANSNNWGDGKYSYYNTSSANSNKPLIESSTVSIGGTTGKGSAHSHTAYFTGTAATLKATAGGSNSSTGGPNGATVGQASAHENMPPYIVQYCWKRTA